MEISISKQQLIVLFGAVLLLIGSFLPVISVPILGSLTLFNNGKSDGLILVVLAILAILLALFNRIKPIRIVAITSLVVVIFDLYRVYSKINDTKSKMSEKLTDNPFGGIANAMIDTIQLQYGWVVLILGCLILLFGSFFKIVKQNNIEQQDRRPITEGKDPLIIESKPMDQICKFCNAKMSVRSLKCDECGSLN